MQYHFLVPQAGFVKQPPIVRTSGQRIVFAFGKSYLTA